MLELNNKIDNLNIDIQILDKKLNIIISNMEKISKNTKRMDSHITFVESIYETVKIPFYYLINKVNNISMRKNILPII
jgi:hypothetical protein